MKLYELTYPETGVTYRLVYIDIERKIDGHLFMFGLDRGHGYERFVVDENLYPAAERYEAIAINEKNILPEIFQTSEPLMIVGYTKTELEWIRCLSDRFGFDIPQTTLYLDAKRGAQKWAATERRGELKELPVMLITHSRFNRPNLKSLVSIARLIGIEPPSDYGYAITSSRFSYAADQLSKKGCFSKLTKVTKAKLTKAMKHNRFDVETMVRLTGVVFQQRKSALIDEISITQP